MAVFLASDCPARGHRVQGGPPGRRMRSAGCAEAGPHDRSLGFGAYEEGGGRPDLASTDKETVNSWRAMCLGRAGKMISRCPKRHRNW